jgi:AraC family transcriptional regulator, alkane utilization regulator
MDALSEILRDIRLSGTTFVEAQLGAPWSFESAPPRALADTLTHDGGHVIPYHLITAGICIVRVPGGEAIELGVGDVVLFPHGDQHLLSGSHELSAPMTMNDISSQLAGGCIVPIRGGGKGPMTGLICGFFACDKRLSAPLLAGLPRVVRVGLKDSPGASLLETTVRYSKDESGRLRPGAAAALGKLSELLFVEAIRRYAEQLQSSQTGWLAGLRDPQIAKALALLHARPAHAWTVEEISQGVGLSRSVFAERFTHYLGQPPVQYLTRWRLALAADRLRDGKARVGRVAEKVGYDSEASFTRAFKREFGLPPAAWRRREVAARPAH